MSSLFFGNVLWRKGMKLSILITLLNEELVLPQTHREISNQLEQMLGKSSLIMKFSTSMMEVVTRPLS